MGGGGAIKIWKPKDHCEIKRLNDIVIEKSKGFVEAAEKDGSPLPPEVHEVVKNGAIVYKKRWLFVPLIWSTACVALALYHYNNPITLITSALIMFIWYDFYSGILHIVLDEPSFIKLPLIGEACLEFQWHHHNPTDLASKSFLEVCGDLNLVITLLVFLYLVPYCGFTYRTPLACCLVSFKMAMAYFGQLCHCMSHTPLNHRPHWVNVLQDAGLMISPKEHGKHHQTYDDNFCIGCGLCNKLLSWSLKNITNNKWVWLVTFLVISVVDVPVMNYMLTTYCGFV
jgi:hypothetical protein